MRKLSVREKTLLTILAALLLVLFWYLFFFTKIDAKKEELIKAGHELEIELAAAAAKNIQLDRVKKELDEIQSGSNGFPAPIAEYDNIAAVITGLKNVLELTDDYSLTFGAVIPDTDNPRIIRRNVSMTFVCGGYNNIKAALKALYDSEFRCLIKDFSVKAEENHRSAAGNETGKVYTATANITFYEYSV